MGYIKSKLSSQIFDNARVRDNARVYGRAIVAENAKICDHSEVYDDASVMGNVEMFDTTRVYGDAIVEGNVVMVDSAQVYGHAIVRGDLLLSGNTTICGNARVYSEDDYITLPVPHTASSYCTAFKAEYGVIEIICGDYIGTIDEFQKYRVEVIRKNNAVDGDKLLSMVNHIKKHLDYKGSAVEVGEPRNFKIPVMVEVWRYIDVTAVSKRDAVMKVEAEPDKYVKMHDFYDECEQITTPCIYRSSQNRNTDDIDVILSDISDFDQV